MTFKNVILTYVVLYLPIIWDLGIFLRDHWLSSLYDLKKVGSREGHDPFFLQNKISAKNKLSVYEIGSFEERVQSNSGKTIKLAV